MFIADFHIHSRYSRATSKECVPEVLELWARRKGLNLIGTGDFTHPAWRDELKEKLVSTEDGLYTLKKDFRRQDELTGPELGPRFIVSGEISSIYKKNGKVRKVHNLILLPSLEAAEALSHRLEAIGNLHSDGRPILGLDSRDLLEISLDVCPEVLFIPAHIWTPHFSLFGAYSGFDDIHECFEDLTDHIHALETGLSSDPPMNWRLSALDGYTLISNSDAHSPANLAREANLFNTDLSYPHIAKALENPGSPEFCGTIEFFPEEGKYHFDGHRNCKICLKPSETIEAQGVCPVCGGRITVGVLHRVEALADRAEGYTPPNAKRFESLIPLHEVIAASMGMTTASKKVKEKYSELIQLLGPELFILREAPLEDIARKAGPLICEGIRRLRGGNVEIDPGYDGEYGKVSILNRSEIDELKGQLCLFEGSRPRRAKAEKIGAEAAQTNRAATAGLRDEAAASLSPEASYGLNPEQWEAVSSVAPAIAVIAGPGTGKTKTLVSRIAYLVEKCKVPPAGITAVTFTNKAAGEMRSRLNQHFGDKHTVKAMQIGTFHAIALKLLSGKGGAKPITLIDEVNALMIMEEILKSLELKHSARDVLKTVSLIKNGACSIESADIPAGVYDLYQAQLNRYGVLDFDDILLNVLVLFEQKGRNAKQESKLNLQFSYLLVDEFQDISVMQYRLIKAWAKSSKSVFIIGDPDQSIYGFRGSDPRCFEQFLQDFSPQKIMLSQNYRSTPEILRCARSVISNAGDPERALEAKRESGIKTRVLEAADPFTEALFVAKEINRMAGGLDMLDAHASSAKHPSRENLKGFADIAILYRTNRQAYTLEQCLLKEDIPYVVAGRDDFLSEPHVRFALAFFRFLINPADLVSLRVCLKSAEIGPAAFRQKAIESYAACNEGFSSLSGIFTALPSSAIGSTQRFFDLLQKYAPAVHKEKPSRLLESWMRDNALLNESCMDMLLNTSVMHESMPDFSQNLTLGVEGDVTRSGKRHYTPEAVTLITLHGAKGLEFPVVFLCGANEGIIPFCTHQGECNPEEERRLFYVGVTRARDELVLMTSGAPSPFLADLPEDTLTRDIVRATRPAPVSKQFTFFDIL